MWGSPKTGSHQHLSSCQQSRFSLKLGFFPPGAIEIAAVETWISLSAPRSLALFPSAGRRIARLVGGGQWEAEKLGFLQHNPVDLSG